MKNENEGTSFFQRVYAAVCCIPVGKVATYGHIAFMCGSPRASRVVGYALHHNPRPIEIPCHRVVDRNGRLAPEFAFGGAKAQQALLKAEGITFVDDTHVDLERHGWHE